jgi:carboxypeptidase C (cathepsin A)
MVLCFTTLARAEAPATRPASQDAADSVLHRQPHAATQANVPASAPRYVADGQSHLSHTTQSLKLPGRTLRYQTTAGTMNLADEAGKPTAHFFFVAYRLLGDPPLDPATRPMTFLFNGGPGAASVWLHLGTVGPQRVALQPGGQPLAPPYTLVPNEQTWLDLSDLVFIDPVGTGYSRPAEGHQAKDFYGVENDLASVGAFIRLYTTRNQRWASPKFLAGESYGTTRAAALSDYLHQQYGLDVNGILLISSVLNFETIQFSDANDLPYPLYLPSYAAIAWYHHKLPADLQKEDVAALANEVKQWAGGDYVTALAKGDALSPDQRGKVIQTLARYTALPRELIDQVNLRIDPGLFQKTLLGGRQMVGRMDGRLTGFETRPTTPWPSYDPSLSRYVGVYSSTFNDYIRRTLGYESDLPYEVLSDKVQPWDFSRGRQGYLYVADDLRSAMLANPALKVFVASGYFDLATPFFATDYTLDHLDLPPELKQHITRHYYAGGHMLYHNTPARERLKADVAAFYEAALRLNAPSPTTTK